MKIETFIPCESLRPFIKSIIIQEMPFETTYKVLPDTGMVIGFQYRGNLSRIEANNATPLSVSGVSGLADHARTFQNSAQIGTVLVCFNEAGAAPFFREPLHELFRESVSLDNFMLRSELLCLEEKLAEAGSDHARVAVIEKFLLARLKITEPDRLVLAALVLIHQSKGNIRIGDLAERLHTSQSPLEKRFRKAVGASLKKFASIVRLKSVVSQYDPHKSLTELGYEAGFYDQAHFIKEFKTFAGDTPEIFFSGKK